MRVNGTRGGEGSAEAGPDLADVGARLERSQLLHSILDPGATIADGYQNWLFALDDGTTLVGRIVEETSELITLETPKKELYDLEPGEVEARKREASSMPADVASHLSPGELRDLVAYLASLKGS